MNPEDTNRKDIFQKTKFLTDTGITDLDIISDKNLK